MNIKLLSGTLLTAALVTTSAFADDGVSNGFGDAYYNQSTESSEFVKVSLQTSESEESTKVEDYDADDKYGFN